MENKLWYAVQIDTSDDWSEGSFDKEEAIKMLLENKNRRLIAVIDNNCCVEEIYKDELL